MVVLAHGMGGMRQLLDIDRQLADVAAALRYVRGHAHLDPTRVVLWGTSFGGGHVLLAAARDDARPGVDAVITRCPFTDGLASALATRPRSAWTVVRRSVRDRVAARRGRRPIMVATAGPPGSVALMTAPDAESGHLALVPDQPHGFRNEVAARVGLSSICHRPGRYTAGISCPVLFTVCDDDTVAPARTTIRHARRAPRAEIRRYPTGHFDIYCGQAFEQVIDDRIEFLTRHVSTEIQPRTSSTTTD
ncbi:alpha/beta hydrolase [Geodermatophilus sp. TF02-6]|uniref:alpha/beta hydrolase n=1 Tax=Geodermatophilus sp. TF02-6 TaxID=2250575 RepID=UPI001F43DC9A|nr:alpha/beta hydrolase [Geodermatophilus sp. TF02-6]